MNKTASQIATEVFEKVAINRMTKEILRTIAKKHPGFPKWYRKALKNLPKHKRNEYSSDLGEMISTYNQKFTREGLPGLKPHESLRERLKVPAGIDLDDIKLPEGLLTARTFAKAPTMRQRISGLHGAGKGEVLIPATREPSLTAIKDLRAAPEVMFRGNPRPGRGESYFVSRHPDVAAEYATKNVFTTDPTKRVFAYPGKKFKGAPVETPADVLDPGVKYISRVAKDPAALDKAISARLTTWKSGMKDKRREAIKILEGRRKTREEGGVLFPRRYFPETSTREINQFLERGSHAAPNYERVIPGKMRPKSLGEYTVRPSRSAEGTPAFAVKRVRGLSPEEVFKQQRGILSPDITDFR